MRIALFGATGRTGQRVLVEARRRGHEVIAVSHRPPAASQPRVIWRRADALDRAQVDAALDGADAVLICLGPSSVADVSMAPATRTILDAMRARGIRRVACQTGAMIGHDPARMGWLLRRMRAGFRARYPAQAADRAAQEREVIESGLDFTLVRPTRLVAGPPTARLVATDARVPSLATSRLDDVARTLLDAIEGQHLRHAVVVISRPPSVAAEAARPGRGAAPRGPAPHA